MSLGFWSPSSLYQLSRFKYRPVPIHFSYNWREDPHIEAVWSLVCEGRTGHPPGDFFVKWRYSSSEVTDGACGSAVGGDANCNAARG